MGNPPYHILVVDDDESLRVGICDLLELAGYTVTAASDGSQALQQLVKMDQLPALIVSDIRMPRMDGYKLLDAVRSRPEWVSVPFIFLSAKGDKMDIRQGKLRGADDYIAKPFEFEDLLVAVQSSLSRHQQINAQQEERMEAIKRRILEIINHEFRTPLTFIVAYAELMASEPAFQHSNELKQYIGGIVEGSERLTRLIENFLVLAEMETGLGKQNYEYRRALIDAPLQLINGVVEGMRPRAEQRGVSLEITSDDPLPAIEGDATYLRIALRELLDNAIKFSPENASVAVRLAVRAEDSCMSITVQDEGIGIPPADQARLFESFHQVNRDLYEQRGTGSGLAIVYHVARLHSSPIRVESTPGKGASFELRLPLPASETPDGSDT